VTPRWLAYWGVWRPSIDLLLGLTAAAAELLHDIGIDRIGRYRLIDSVLWVQDRT
jgi:hypothetical protein